MSKQLLSPLLLLFSLYISFTTATTSQQFKQAPKFFNSPNCPSLSATTNICSETAVHVAMTLDAAYLRGSMAAILSILQHSSCPQNTIFHFIISTSSSALHLRSTVATSFPYLHFHLYKFDEAAAAGHISTSIRSALDCPLNYARNYLSEILPLCISKVIYLDSDIIVVDDILKLAATPLGTTAVVAAPEYCKANFTFYFTPTFWSNPSLSLTFVNRKACYFNTGYVLGIFATKEFQKFNFLDYNDPFFFHSRLLYYILRIGFSY